MYKNTVLNVLEKSRGLSSKEVCTKLGLPQTQYSDIKSGKLIPSLRVQGLLEGFYDMPFKKLVAEVTPLVGEKIQKILLEL